jgi:CRP-like cAMP-binding protein
MNRSQSITEPTNTSCQISNFLSKGNFSRLESIMHTMNAPEGSQLFCEGDPADKLFFVKKGQVNVTKATEDGKELILYILQKGDMFGELGGFDEIQHTLNATAMTACVVGVIEQKDLELLVYQYGDFAVDFMKWMGLMQRTTQSKFRDLLMFGKTGALASTLVRLSNSYGVEADKGIRINMHLTNTDLANMVGTTRESVNRLLSSYKEDGVLSYDRGQIIIHDVDYFKKIVCCPNCPSDICRI